MTKTIITVIGLGSAGALAAEHDMWPDAADAHRLAQWALEVVEMRSALDTEQRERERPTPMGLTDAEARELGRYLERPELREIMPGFDEAESLGSSALGLEVKLEVKETR